MIVKCTIDSAKYTINVNSDKSLHSILVELSENFAVNNSCLGADCGNCIVLLNGSAVLSCLIPACKLTGASIVTFEAFSKTRGYQDIEKALADTGYTPCPQCYASKILLIESVVDKIMKQQGRVTSGKNIKGNTSVVDSDYIAKEFSLNSCQCMEVRRIERIIQLTCQYRKKRHA